MSAVLIIDDDKEYRSNLKKKILETGYAVLEAPDALEVTDIIMREKSNIELIILDLQIAEVDGKDIYEIVHDYAPRIPIIVSSVLPIRDQKFKIPRARDYSQKLDGLDALMGKIRAILGITEKIA